MIPAYLLGFLSGIFFTLCLGYLPRLLAWCQGLIDHEVYEPRVSRSHCRKVEG